MAHQQTFLHLVPEGYLYDGDDGEEGLNYVLGRRRAGFLALYSIDEKDPDVILCEWATVVPGLCLSQRVAAWNGMLYMMVPNSLNPDMFAMHVVDATDGEYVKIEEYRYDIFFVLGSFQCDEYFAVFFQNRVAQTFVSIYNLDDEVLLRTVSISDNDDFAFLYPQQTDKFLTLNVLQASVEGDEKGRTRVLLYLKEKDTNTSCSYQNAVLVNIPFLLTTGTQQHTGLSPHRPANLILHTGISMARTNALHSNVFEIYFTKLFQELVLVEHAGSMVDESAEERVESLVQAKMFDSFLARIWAN